MFTRVLTGARRRFILPTVAALGAWLAVAVVTAQAAPPAGTPIGNQASATYLDASATSRTVTSNLVTTVVQQVASFTLTADGVRTAAPGGQGVFPHTLTNTGNGPDAFQLRLYQLPGDDFDFSAVVAYVDADGNGVPDNFTPLASTGALAAGASFRFVLVGNVPGTQVGGDIGRARITGVSTFDSLQTAFNTDQVNVSGNAVVSVTKAINQPAGNSPSGPYTYTLSYVNSGNGAAGVLQLNDVLPAGMTYVNGSARWSTTGAAVLTDADSSDAQGVVPNTVKYDFGVSAGGAVHAVVRQVPAGGSGTLTFQVNVAGGLAPQVINNSATYAYNDGVGNVGPFTTNLAPFTVGQTASLTFVGQTIPSTTQGATLVYVNTLTNTGNGTDTFDVTLGASSFPVGTSYVLYRSDGVTPLTDSDGNFIPDTGPIAAGGVTAVVLQVTLPPSATGGPFQVQKTATSRSNALANATATDILTTITPNAVDVTNNTIGPAAPGAGTGPEALAVITNTTSPGTTTRFTLYVNNNSTVADNFDLAASTDNTFGSLTLPAGWTVTFRDFANSVITGTGPIAPGDAALVYADVDVPAGFAAGTTGVYFRAQSPVSGAFDRIHDAVTVSALRSLTLVPNNSAQVAPGGSITYTHLLSNSGNVIEGDGVGSTVSLLTVDTQVGWTSTLYVDTNNNGIFDGGIDQPITDLGTIGGVAPSTSVRIFVQVFAPAGAPLGQVNLTQVSLQTNNVGYVTPAPGPVSATDQTTVLNGQVQIVKRQVLDGNCDGVPDGAYTLANIGVGAVPGACLRYEIVVTNVGTASITNLVVSDATPVGTTYSSVVPASTTVGSVVPPANGAAGTVTATIGVLAPGQTATVVFGLRIDP